MAQINKPTDYFNTVLYTGTGAIQSVTGVGFQPDWLWTKIRSNTGNHTVWDSVRGANASLQTSTSNAEGSSHIDSFDSDGFTLDAAIQNTSGETFVAWNWLASNTTASNTDGSITSSVSALTTSGFSIVSYTGNGTAGATIGHGLGTAPSMIISKRRSGVENWGCYHKSLGASKYINLDTTTSATSSTSRWNGTEPTSSVFSVGSHASVNGNNDTYIAYCFAEKKGFSKFGSYSGNSSNDGTFVYTGFKPAMVIVKCSNSVENWVMWDNKRSPFNVVNDRLFPNLSNAESTSPDICDLVSNGFKFRYGPEGSWNTSGNNYIYMAFAENPLVGTNNIPSTAR